MMRMFRPSDKVVCIDATPIPAKCAKANSIKDFVLPDGFVEEGRVYCVESVRLRHDGRIALGLIGKPIIVNGRDVLWNSQRFRWIPQKSLS